MGDLHPPRVTRVDRLPYGIAIEFGDGRTLIFSGMTLSKTIPGDTPSRPAGGRSDWESVETRFENDGNIQHLLRDADVVAESISHHAKQLGPRDQVLFLTEVIEVLTERRDEMNRLIQQDDKTSTEQ
jgi:hypothetical protein